MIMTATQNNMDFEAMPDAMGHQRPHIHLSQRGIGCHNLFRDVGRGERASERPTAQVETGRRTIVAGYRLPRL